MACTCISFFFSCLVESRASPWQDISDPTELSKLCIKNARLQTIAVHLQGREQDDLHACKHQVHMH